MLTKGSICNHTKATCVNGEEWLAFSVVKKSTSLSYTCQSYMPLMKALYNLI